MGTESASDKVFPVKVPSMVTLVGQNRSASVQNRHARMRTGVPVQSCLKGLATVFLRVFFCIF